MKKAELSVMINTETKNVLKPAEAITNPAISGIKVGKIFPAPDIPA